MDNRILEGLYIDFGHSMYDLHKYSEELSILDEEYHATEDEEYKEKLSEKMIEINSLINNLEYDATKTMNNIKYITKGEK